MIGYLKGQVFRLLSNYCLLNVNGVGYRVFLPESTRNKLKPGSEAELFIRTVVREDAITLYGFASMAEYDMFELLTSVSGIGPKVALGVLSTIAVNELIQAIGAQKTALLTKLPGIGKKSAERLVLELKDKVAFGETEGAPENTELDFAADTLSEAKAALISLGYSAAEITPALRGAKDAKTVQEAIRLALKALSRGPQ